MMLAPGRGVTRFALLALAAFAACVRPDEPATPLPDLSGLVWVRDGLFVAVHDSKLPDERDRPRLGVVRLPAAAGGRTLDVRWPPAGASSDLESAARVPGTELLLLAESGDDGGPHRRIFPATLEGDSVRVGEPVPWPAAIVNVEGIAVARVGEGFLFLYAERSHDEPSTLIRWAPLRTGPLSFGAFREARFTLPAGTGMNRPVSALEVDAEGWIYAASTFDPDVDDGPFRSTVWRIGRVGEGGVRIGAVPTPIARVDGIKIESLAIRELPGGGRQLVMGSDDENLGAVLRPLPVSVAAPSESGAAGTGGRR